MNQKGTDKKHYIDEYKSYKDRPDGKSWGYNMTTGGGGMSGFKHSEATKAKLRISSSGRKHTEEWKRSVSGKGNHRYGVKLSAAYKLRLSKIATERYKEPEGGAQVRQKIGEGVKASHASRSPSNRGTVVSSGLSSKPFRATIMINSQAIALGNHLTKAAAKDSIAYFIKHGRRDPRLKGRTRAMRARGIQDEDWLYFPSKKDAVKTTGVSASCVTNVCNGGQASSKGWIFEYVHESS